MKTLFSESCIHSSLYKAVEEIWGTTCQAVVLLGEGVYGRCYGIRFASPPYQAVIKIHKYPGTGKREEQQLIELGTHIPDLIPHVYACLTETAVGEMLVMEWLPGKSCPQPELLPHKLRASLQQQSVDLLLKLHAIQHLEGFGAFDGPFYERWWDYYGQRVRSTYETIISNEEARLYFGPQTLALMDRTLEHSERILDTDMRKPVLLHGDFCFGNLLFDRQTWRISGLIDPLDAEWGSRELDLVNVINGHVKHFELVNRYREVVDLGPYFPARYWFYQIWKWLSYYVQIRVKCREWVLRCGREFTKEIERVS